MIKHLSLGLLLGLGMLIVPVASGQSNGLIVDLNLGKAGSASQLIHAPLVGQPTRDSHWVYDRFPDGSKNPAFPPPAQAPQLPVQVGFPAVLVDVGQIFRPFPDQVLVHPVGSDTDHTSQEVLLPGVTLQVDATLPWVKTGFVVKSGQKFYIQASGTWSNHFDQAWCGPEGHLGMPTSDKSGHPPQPCSTANHGALVARIGTGGTGFAVGTSGEFTATRDGEVQLMCNDTLEGPEGYTPGPTCILCENMGFSNNSHLGNNQGALTVTLSLFPFP
ncbi:MAG TPA: hypothetical protein PKO06_18240, partial [Candidatus Ozemobacteraceae bacterium]|nr:hypothetical protein [Candidatus Ozemobacteraceae bacterium]